MSAWFGKPAMSHYFSAPGVELSRSRCGRLLWSPSLLPEALPVRTHMRCIPCRKSLGLWSGAPAVAVALEVAEPSEEACEPHPERRMERGMIVGKDREGNDVARYVVVCDGIHYVADLPWSREAFLEELDGDFVKLPRMNALGELEWYAVIRTTRFLFLLTWAEHRAGYVGQHCIQGLEVWRDADLRIESADEIAGRRIPDAKAPEPEPTPEGVHPGARQEELPAGLPRGERLLVLMRALPSADVATLARHLYGDSRSESVGKTRSILFALAQKGRVVRQSSHFWKLAAAA